MLKSLDLFTGIAGFTLGLRDVAQPVAYCEIDPHATQILQHRMTEGRIPKAPICNDVLTLNEEWLQTTVQNAKVDIITAGFPCQTGHNLRYALTPGV